MSNILDSEKSCKNCAHRSGSSCERTGYQTKTELMFGGRCAKDLHGTELVLWEKREPLFVRILAMFKTETP